MPPADGVSARFTRKLDAESERFEAELLAGPSAPALALSQTHLYLSRTPREFWLFQARDAQGKPAMQAAVYVSRSRVWKQFAQGSVPRMSATASREGERFFIVALKKACLENTDLMTLRLQPYRLEAADLDAFEGHAKSEGFDRVPALDVTRTLLMDLKPTPEELLAGFRPKTRATFKHRSRDEVILRSIADPAFVRRCQEAERAAFVRTGGKTAGYDFETHFRLANEKPDRAFAFGLFLPSRPNELLAFVTGVRHGKVAEYQSAGSFSDPELRQVPFNYFLIWELILWARKSGAELFDLGGVSAGGDDDPLAGITRFKRYLCDHEVEIGRELLSVLRPRRYALFQAMYAVLAKVRR
jgi:hypothetical protein